MQQTARDYLASIYEEHEKASQHLEAQRKEYEDRENYLDKCQAQNKTERRKLQWQKQKVTFIFFVQLYPLTILILAMTRGILYFLPELDGNSRAKKS